MRTKKLKKKQKVINKTQLLNEKLATMKACTEMKISTCVHKVHKFVSDTDFILYNGLF